MTGRVYLVGAGPGDPGLLTVRAERCLATADVVVHDYLVGPRLLAQVRPGAEVIALEQSADEAERPGPSAIVDLLVGHARAGKMVVRLKNGDPFLFGRGAEEVEALGSAGVPFEIVPGVSAALAVPAYAGIPLTHRDHASLVTIATGHQAGADRPAALPWEALARRGGTLVFLMGMRQLPVIMAELVRHGLAADTPAAAVQWGTTGRQATVVATAGTLAAQVQARGLGPPGVVVVGTVVDLRARASWFERRPLFGRCVVVTRPRAQAGTLIQLLEAEGAEVIPFPTIALGPPPDPAVLDRAVAASAGYDWILFTSANGVQAFFERFAALGRDVRELVRVRLGAIGPATAAELERRLLRPSVLPDDHRAEGLLAALAGEDLRGRRLLLPRAAGARAILPRTLEARGAVVDEVIAYRAVPPADAGAAGLRAALAAGTVDALTFTSSSTVRHFADLLGATEVARLGGEGGPVIACIGPVTAATARELGLRVAVMPARYTVPALARALVEHFCNGAADHLCGEGR
jgi:uroporphyrinogen III methyltransferase/synthase